MVVRACSSRAPRRSLPREIVAIGLTLLPGLAGGAMAACETRTTGTSLAAEAPPPPVAARAPLARTIAGAQDGGSEREASAARTAAVTEEKRGGSGASPPASRDPAAASHDTRPVCARVGTRSEGWAWPDGRFIHWARCRGETPRCEKGRDGLGWYAKGALIVQAPCKAADERGKR